MKENELQNRVYFTYINNMRYLEEKHTILYEKLKLFEYALENDIEERYILEYKDNYFDVYDNLEKVWMYNTNSNTYSDLVVKNENFNSTENTFKTFYDFKYEDDVVEKSINSSILSAYALGISPVVHYVTKQLPEQEIMKKIYNYIIFGVLLGIHIPLLHKKIRSRIYHIIEPSLELFRLSLFVTDYTEIAKDSDIIFYIAEEKESFYSKIQRNYFETFFYNHYIKFFIFNKNCEIYINTIQDMLVSQVHYLYSFDRELMSFDRTFNYAEKAYNYIDVSSAQYKDEIKNIPTLILGAGPSLRRNLDFIKKEQKSFFIVALYGILTLLEENNIIPDIVVQYDEVDESAYGILAKIKDLNFFKNTLFLFASHVDNKIVESFDKNNIFIFQAMYKAKENLGSFTSPSVGELSYALSQILGFRKIYLLGIDMALDVETEESHFEGYFGNDATKEKEERSNEEYSFRKNILKIKGNFLEEVKTLPLYTISIRHINHFTMKYKSLFDTTIYNLSNGAYFENTIPLKPSEFNAESVPSLNKILLYKEIKEFYNSISRNNFTEEDKIINEHKFSDALVLKRKLEEFKKSKNLNEDDFKNSLHNLHNEFCKDYFCYDLQKILNNYSSSTIHYIFYFFNLNGISNKKKHIKKLQNLFHLQLLKIVEEYLRILKKYSVDDELELNK